MNTNLIAKIIIFMLILLIVLAVMMQEVKLEINEEIVFNSLKGINVEQKYLDVLERIFYLKMVDRWTQEDKKLNDILYNIKQKLEKEMEKENE